MNIKSEIKKYKKMNQDIRNVILISQANVADIIMMRKNKHDLKQSDIFMKKNKHDLKEMDKDMVMEAVKQDGEAVSYTHLRAHETRSNL
eukprot:10622993-Heterocapsa_arctica.AAC.1